MLAHPVRRNLRGMRLALALACVCACSASSGSGASDGGAPLGDAPSGSSSGASGGSSGAATDSGSSGSSGGSGSSSGSSSGSGGDGGGTSLYCSVITNGVLKSCLTYTNVPSNDVSGFTQSCTFEQGTIVGSCPGTNQVGCCQQTIDQVSASDCFYCGPVSMYEAACTGAATWMAGSGGTATCEGPD
jgi:hypothetical protein